MIEKSDYYYLVEQNINDLVHNKHNCYDSLDRVKYLCSILCGNISVYKIHAKTNQYENFTYLYGKKEQIDENTKLIKIEKIYYKTNQSLTIAMFNIVKSSVPTKEYDQAVEKVPLFLEKDSAGKEFAYTSYNAYNISFFTLTSIRSRLKKASQYNDLKGSSYERFIGSKYEDSEHHVIYHGIEQKLQDNGIDLIAQKKDRIIFIQCKNWVGGKYNKLFRKDLQAFAGDCFLFMQKPNNYNLHFEGKNIILHFIVNKDQLLDESAKKFLKQNPFIKFKIIEFTENE